MLWPHLQLQRQGQPLCSTVEAPGTLAETVESCYLVLAAEACPGHQRASTQKDVVAASTQFIRIKSNDLNRRVVRHLIRVKTSVRSCKNHLYSITVPLGFCAAFCSTSSCLHLRQEEDIEIMGAEEQHHGNVSRTPVFRVLVLLILPAM